MNQPEQDVEHLRLLSIFHYVAGGLLAVMSCIPIIHVIVGLVFLNRPNLFPGAGRQPIPLETMGALFIIIGAVVILIGWVSAALVLLAGRSLARRRHYTFCVIVAGLSCLSFPIGTALGVFTLVVLLRPSVKPLFE